MAQVTITGTIKLVGKTQDISEKFRKRELILTEGTGQYPQQIPVEFTQDKTGLLDGYAPGELVTVMAYVNGREWTGRDGVTKYFLSLKGERIDRAGAAKEPGSSYQATPPPTVADMPVGGEDDLPF